MDPGCLLSRLMIGWFDRCCSDCWAPDWLTSTSWTIAGSVGDSALRSMSFSLCWGRGFRQWSLVRRAMIAKLATMGVDRSTFDFPHTTQPRTELTSSGKLLPSGIRPGTRKISKKTSAPMTTSTGVVVSNVGSASLIPGGMSQYEVSMLVAGRSTVTFGRTMNSRLVEYSLTRNMIRETNLVFAWAADWPIPLMGRLIFLRRALMR